MFNLKRIGALALAAVMTLGFSSVAFAADENPATTTVVDKTVTADDATVSIKKEMVFINAEATTVREPNIVYTYTISAASGVSATVTDANGLTGTVKDGVAGAIVNATDTITFTDTVTASASANGVADVKYASFSFNQDVFTAPGIYRYKIVETQTPAKAAVGVTEAGTYDNVRFLDVYVQKKSADLAAGAGNMKVYGYVLYEDGTNDDVSFDATTGAEVNLGKKSEGFVNTAENEGEQEDVDVYKTQNLYINKETTGVLADKGHDFPIEIAMTAPNGVTVATKLDITLANNGTLASVQTDTVGDYLALGTLTGTVRDTSAITIKGIPEGAAVVITETNDTPDSYKVTMQKTVGSASATDIFAQTIVDSNNTAAASSLTMSDKVVVDIENLLEAISPTGVAMRFAPYAMMLGFGIVLFVLSKKSRDEEMAF